MLTNTLLRRIIFNSVFLAILAFIYFSLFYDVYTSNNIIISFAVHPFNICERFPDYWFYIKLLYILITIISSLICINIIYSIIFVNKKVISKKSPSHVSDLNLKIFNEVNNNLIIPEAGLYQNFLITGTIGSGKTSSVMYPFTRQLIKYKCNDTNNKLGILILDVKGNYYSMVEKYASYYGRENDLIVIEIRSEI